VGHIFISQDLAIRKATVWAVLTNVAVIEDAGRFMQEKKKELEQQSLQRQPIEKPPQENEQEQQQEQEPKTFNKTF
jgi:hypothetical protein